VEVLRGAFGNSPTGNSIVIIRVILYSSVTLVGLWIVGKGIGQMVDPEREDIHNINLDMMDRQKLILCFKDARICKEALEAINKAMADLR
jgi:hypothetical protein